MTPTTPQQIFANILAIRGIQPALAIGLYNGAQASARGIGATEIMQAREMADRKFKELQQQEKGNEKDSSTDHNHRRNLRVCGPGHRW